MCSPAPPAISSGNLRRGAIRRLILERPPTFGKRLQVRAAWRQGCLCHARLRGSTGSRAPGQVDPICVGGGRLTGVVPDELLERACGRQWCVAEAFLSRRKRRWLFLRERGGHGDPLRGRRGRVASAQRQGLGEETKGAGLSSPAGIAGSVDRRRRLEGGVGL